MLTIRGLERPGLEPIDLDLAPGACVAIGGPSGAGKTLMLRALADLDPHDGTVAFEAARIDAPDSELVVFNSGHSAQSHPLAIQEVRRILLDALDQGPLLSRETRQSPR